jgi:hypothetical protein
MLVSSLSDPIIIQKDYTGRFTMFYITAYLTLYSVSLSVMFMALKQSIFHVTMSLNLKRQSSYRLSNSDVQKMRFNAQQR